MICHYGKSFLIKKRNSSYFYEYRSRRCFYMDNKLSFTNDVFFKFMLTREDEGSNYLLNLIIKDIFHLQYSSLQITNPEIITNSMKDKRIFLDILLKDDEGRPIDIEM